MIDNTATGFLDKKAFEISYAVFRVAESSPFKPFAERIQNQAMAVLEEAILRNYEKADQSATMLSYFVQLGASVGLIGQNNGGLIVMEINNFKSAIAESINVAKENNINLDDIFSKVKVPAIKTTFIASETNNPVEVLTSTSEHDPEQSNQGIFKIAMRHSAILSKIRQTGNCRLKDIQESLPDISERTIRYDLQKLAEQGLIERIGSGGPATYYQVKA